tara:strand:+ start:13130 stop:13339 length:210 start_codon:yes stop_codon:yes gene_type:complete
MPRREIRCSIERHNYLIINENYTDYLGFQSMVDEIGIGRSAFRREFGGNSLRRPPFHARTGASGGSEND